MIKVVATTITLTLISTLFNGYAELVFLASIILASYFILTNNNRVETPTIIANSRLLATSLFSVFALKILSTTWSIDIQTSINSAIRHLMFGLSPLLFFTPINPSNFKRTYITLGLATTTILTALLILIFGNDFLWSKGRLNTGVMAQIILAIGSICYIEFLYHKEKISIQSKSIYFLASIGSILIIHATTRRIEMISLVLIFISSTCIRHRNLITLKRAAAICFVTSIALLLTYFANQGKWERGYHEIIYYFTATTSPSKEFGIESSMGLRMEMYYRAIHAFLDRPLLGWGAGITPDHLSDYKNYSTHNPLNGHFHSQYLQILVESGIIGLLVSATMVFIWLKVLVLNRQSPESIRLMSLAVFFTYALEGITSAALVYGAASVLMCTLTFLLFTWTMHEE